ncbi:MAG TPA: hypothetical protein VKY65_21415 [Alphaproteobacteria bacterium]|nr:hypothetical protein [Alphaproteobacteria bacterium]
MPAERHERASAHPAGALSLAVVLLVVSFFLMSVFQTIELIHDHGALSDLRAAQEPTVQEALKVRHQLESLAGGTAQLAADGDAAARSIVETMRRQGITLTPPKKP